MAADEASTWHVSSNYGPEPSILQFDGSIVGSAGDSLLVEAGSAVNAVQCAIEMQEKLVAEGGTIYGDGVNIAARLEKPNPRTQSLRSG